MNPEISIVKAFLTYSLWEQYSTQLSPKDFPEELQLLYRTLDSFHKTQNDTKENLHVNDLANLFFASKPKDTEFYEGVFNNLRTYEPNIATVLALIISIKRSKVLRALSIASYEAAEGKGSYDKVVTLTELLKEDKKETVATLEFVNDDLEFLVEEAVSKPGLRWRLNCLNKSMGSLRKGDFGFVFSRPESFSRDTEVLTPQGWLTVDKVTTDTYIAQVTKERQTIFVKPLAVHPHEQEECYHIHDTLGRVDLLVTKGHSMVVDKQGELFKERADTIKYYQGVKHHVAAPIGNTVGIGFNALTRLQIAYQADGRTREYITHGYSNHSYGYEISVLKDRKVKRLQDILKEFEFSSWQDKRGHTGFYIKSFYRLYKDFEWVNLQVVDRVWCQQFIEELSYWDATRRTDTRFKFDTTNKLVADKVQAIAILAGYNCLLSKFEDNRKETYSDIYSLSIRTEYTPIDGQCIQKTLVKHTDTTYCFEVPSGMLLVRRNGATAVCGNTGKTTFLASEVSYMLPQTDKPIVWINNEEAGNKVMLRVYQAFFGITREELFANTKKYKALFQEKSQGRFKLYDSANTDKYTIERICKQFDPGLLVIDQIDKIKGFDADRNDLQLGAIYIWAREIAKQYCPTIGICQADGTAENVRYLTMSNVANAKTAKQAEADFILGIGTIHDTGWEAIRFLNISKNKLMGDTDTDSSLRHSKMEVFIKPNIARYADM